VLVLPLLLLILVGAVLAVVGLVGVGPLASWRGRARHEERARWAVLVLVAPIGLVVLVVLLGLLTGLRVAGGPDEDGGGHGVAGSERPMTPNVPSRLTGAIDSDALGPVVRLRGEAGAVGGLDADTVLRVVVDGFPSFASAQAVQCAGDVCGNAIPVQFDEGGRAAFQYLVSDAFAPAAASGGCRLDAPACSLRVESTDGDDRASIVTLFVDELPGPGTVRVEPSRALRPRQTVDVQLEHFASNASIELLVCSPPATSGVDRCSSAATTRVGSDGGAVTTLRVPGSVGRDRVDCEESACAVHVASTSAFVRSTPVRLHYALPAPVDYDGGRLLVGLVVAAALVALAMYLLQRTDWSPVGEEAAPEIDDAEYADLDALVAAMPPAEDLDELVARTS